MDWRTDWSALHDRIAGVERAFDLFIGGLQLEEVDAYGIRRKIFREYFSALLDGLQAFAGMHGRTLPPAAQLALTRFLKDHSRLLADSQLDNTSHVVACVTTLSAFRAEFSYQLSERGARALRLTERALQHLQRSIVADSAVRDRWQIAFEAGETACEQLGAAHLLLHGIWAFKVSAAGERTDLVYNEPIVDADAVSADALVLTEWKLVRHSQELEAKHLAATRQCQLYSQGVLGGIELATSRFVVIVSSNRLPLPADSEVHGIFLRTRGIAVAPATPSRSSATLHFRPN